MMRLSILICGIATTLAFTISPQRTSLKRPSLLLRKASNDWESDEPFERSNLDKFLSIKYPAFYALVSMDDEILKVIQENKSVTVFAPNKQAFDALGEKKLAQLADPRNLETVQKICAYHIVPDEAVPATRLFQEDWTVPKTKQGKPELSFRGVMTMAGGDVSVSRSKSGGFLGLWKEDDGGVIIGPDAKIVQSFNVGATAIVHEVNSLVSPILLWRFMDQLRIPGF